MPVRFEDAYRVAFVGDRHDREACVPKGRTGRFRDRRRTV
jgi:hypothetical protein